MGIGHGNSDKPEHDEPMITVSELARMVRLSRATIQYYEKIGILNPDRTDNRHRYPASDCVRLTNTMTLKTSGSNWMTSFLCLRTSLFRNGI